MSEGNNPFDLIPEKDILPLVLSYVERGDIKNVRLTCTRFYNASQHRSFWKINITRFLMEHMKDVRLVRGFDTFSMGDRETLRQQVEFIFCGEAFFKKRPHSKLVGCVDWARRTHDDYVLIYEYDSKTLLYYAKFYFWSTGWFPYDTMAEMWEQRDNGCVDYEYIAYEKTGANFDDKRNRVTIHYYHDNFSYCWKGGCCANGLQAAPHGDGEWIFDNGVVLKGECMAYKGQMMIPAKLLKDEEMES